MVELEAKIKPLYRKIEELKIESLKYNRCHMEKIIPTPTLMIEPTSMTPPVAP